MTALTPWKTVLFQAAMLLVAVASAQTEASGTIEGSLGGEERSWYTIRMATEDEVANTAEWTNPFGDFYTFSVQGHRDVGFSVEGTLSLEFSFFAGLPESCPCPADEASIIYFSSGEMLRDIYEGEDASITVTELEVLDDETTRIAGEFSATLLYIADLMTDPDPERTLEVSGSFETTASRLEVDF